MQVQDQLAICDKDCCDFICWPLHGLHVEWINRKESTFLTIEPALDLFFKTVILLQLVRNGTKACASDQDTLKNDCKAAIYCICKKEEFGRMIACDNPNCKIIWFHFTCVGLTHTLKGKYGFVVINAKKYLHNHNYYLNA